MSVYTTDRTVSFRALSDALSVSDGGFSVNMRTGEQATTGYAVSLWPEREMRTHKVGPVDLAEYVHANSDLLLSESVNVQGGRGGQTTMSTSRTVFGGWRSPDDGAAYLDVSIVVDTLDGALTLARKFGQLAVFDFSAGQSISTEPIAISIPTA